MRILSPSERSALRARAHKLHPVVLIGDSGLTDEVLLEIDHSLVAHELIKIRVAGADREDRDAILKLICEKLEAAPVQHIGRILVLFRPRPQGVQDRRPRRRPKAPARQPKRSFQSR